MKRQIIMIATAVLLAACSSKHPPKPHGTPFPINATAEGNTR